MINSHVPVLFSKCLDWLNIKPGGCYVDATYGRGGHASGILNRLSDDGFLFVFDRDGDAIEHAKSSMSAHNVKIYHRSFADFDLCLDKNSIDGVLFDLGVSSPQLDDGDRGFSFRSDALLDMRFDQSHGETVASWLGRAKFSEIADVLYWYGEEKLSRQIARAIVAKRESGEFNGRTKELADIVYGIYSRVWSDFKVHPATKTFQALRIYINQELEHLEKSFLSLSSLLKNDARVVILTFHALETRMVRAWSRGEKMLTDGKVSGCKYKILHQESSDIWEVRDNNRARSAKLIVLEKSSEN